MNHNGGFKMYRTVAGSNLGVAAAWARKGAATTVGARRRGEEPRTPLFGRYGMPQHRGGEIPVSALLFPLSRME